MAKKPPSLDDQIRGLYHGPLGEFIAGRQALAKRLRQAGDPRHAEVAELRKPSISAAAVNQLFACEARALAALVGAGERARAAQGRGKGADPAALGELVATIRAETERLTGRGVEILAATSRAPGDAIVERLRTDLQALAIDPATAEVAARGWLDEDLPPPGFELLAALQVAAAPARPGPRAVPSKPAAPAPDPAGKPRKATVHSLDEARSAVAERRKSEERQRRERVEKARAALATAEAEAAAARRTAERAGREAERAERAAAEAERRAEAARSTARAARRSAGEAGEQAAAAEAKAARAREALTETERT